MPQLSSTGLFFSRSRPHERKANSKLGEITPCPNQTTPEQLPPLIPTTGIFFTGTSLGFATIGALAAGGAKTFGAASGTLGGVGKSSAGVGADAFGTGGGVGKSNAGGVVPVPGTAGGGGRSSSNSPEELGAGGGGGNVRGVAVVLAAALRASSMVLGLINPREAC